MIRTTPFHARTAALNESGLWSHWSGHLAAEKYGLSDKFEYFAVRNAAGLFDTSPLFKYRFSGPGAERVPGRRPRPRPARARAGSRDVRDLVRRPRLRRRGRRAAAARRRTSSSSPPPSPTSPTSRTSSTRRDKVTIEEVSQDWGVLSLQGPRARRILAGLVPSVESLPYFGITSGQDRRLSGDDLAHRLHRRPGLRGVGQGRERAADVGRAVGGDARLRRAAVRAPGAVHDPDRGRPAAARRRLRVEPVRLDGRRPRDAPGARASAGCSRASTPTTAPSSAATRSAARPPRRPRASGRPGSSSTGGTGTASTTRRG